MTPEEKWAKLIEWIEGLATDPEKIMTILMHWVRANDIDHEDPPEGMFSPEAFRRGQTDWEIPVSRISNPYQVSSWEWDGWDAGWEARQTQEEARYGSKSD